MPETIIMSLQALLKAIDESRKKESMVHIDSVKRQYEDMLQAKEQEIATLKEEIETLRCWLDHSALPAANPISKRMDSMGLIKLNFGQGKPCPELWEAGEKELMEKIRPSEIQDDNGLPEPPIPFPFEQDRDDKPRPPSPKLSAKMTVKGSAKLVPSHKRVSAFRTPVLFKRISDGKSLRATVKKPAAPVKTDAPSKPAAKPRVAPRKAPSRARKRRR
jgi:hypothetical protein